MTPAQFQMGHAVATGDARHQRNRDAATRRPAEGRRRAHPVNKAANPDAVLRAFNTWAFKREQPADPQLLARTVSEAVGRGEPVSFILYWGKGPRARAGAPEVECLDYLAALSGRVREAYPAGAAIELIFTDTHAGLNGHTREAIGHYFAEIEAKARQRGFATQWLSELVRAAEASDECAIDDRPASEELLQHLSTSAGKWYRGEGTALDGALKYYQMNMIEKRAVELAFPRSIFVTFNGSDLRCLFPDRLPVFYMYSLRRGVSVKPWFLPATVSESLERVDQL
jgi:hypothetical protein